MELPSAIMTRLCAIESSQKDMQCKLSKFDKIEADVKAISNKLTRVEVKVMSLEHKMSESDKNLADLALSRSVDSDACQDIKKRHALLNCMKNLKSENTLLSENIFDLQARSMRDNLLVFNFDEEKSFKTRKAENCINKIIQFCERDLHIENAADNIKSDRAHRVGHFEEGKKRPIVAKFNFYGDKLNVKANAREHLSNTSFRVGDQYPNEIQDRRRKLVPYLVQARQAGKVANLSYDTLYIDRVKYTHDHLPPGPPPTLPPRGPRNQTRGGTGQDRPRTS